MASYRRENSSQSEDAILLLLHKKIRNENPSKKWVEHELTKISNRGRKKWKDVSPLRAAVEANSSDLVRLMVERCGLDIDSVDGFEKTPLSCAISNCNLDMVNFLVNDMGATHDREEIRLFHFSRKILDEGLSEEEVKEFLSNISNRDRSEWTVNCSPLHSAVEASRQDLVLLMVKMLGFKVDAVIKFSGGTSPLICAIGNKNLEMVNFLVTKMKANVSPRKTKFHPLNRAIKEDMK